MASVEREPQPALIILDLGVVMLHLCLSQDGLCTGACKGGRMSASKLGYWVTWVLGCLYVTNKYSYVLYSYDLYSHGLGLPPPQKSLFLPSGILGLRPIIDCLACTHTRLYTCLRTCPRMGLHTGLYQIPGYDILVMTY